MKVVFLLGSPDISGGTFVIFQHAIFLQRNGFDVTIVTEEEVTEERISWHPDAKLIKFVDYPEIANEHFDVAIATWWVTVFKLHRVKAEKYAFFNQSVESRFYKENDHASRRWADSAYLLKLPVITEATWIKDYLADNYGLKSHLVFNGVRKDVYREDVEPIAEREPGKLRVLVEGAMGVFFKNVDKTIELCACSNADEVWLLTATRGVEEVEGVDRVFSCVPIADTAKIYNSCDVIVKLSYVEGMFGPPLEMFHCGGTAIVYNVSGHDEYIKHGENAIVVERDDEQGVVDWLNKLKDEPELLARLKEGGRKAAKAWPDWGTSSQNFLEAVKKLKDDECESYEDLKRKSQFFEGWFGDHVAVQQESGRFAHEINQSHSMIAVLRQQHHAHIARLETTIRHLELQLEQLLNSKALRAVKHAKEAPVIGHLVSKLTGKPKGKPAPKA